MEILLPLDKSLSTDWELLEKSHLERRFIIFDEDLRIFFHIPQGTIETISVYINEARVYASANPEQSIEKHASGLWELRKFVVTEHIFGSSIVMNNGHKNIWKIVLEYREGVTSSKEANDTSTSEAEDFLPSFKPLNTPRTNKSSSEQQQGPTLKSLELMYPIHSLLNARLRNVSVPLKQCIFSSLDLQSSKACNGLITQYQLENLKIVLDEIDYRLVHNFSTAAVSPVNPLELPLELELWDSYSVNYQLPQTRNLESHRVRVSLRYTVRTGPSKFLIRTRWETDVTVRKQSMPMSLPSQPTSIMSTPMLTPSMKFTSAMNSLVANKLNNVKIKFLTSSVTCKKGVKFLIPLQIINQSQTPLELVVYCTNLAVQPQRQLPIEKEYQLHKRWMKTTDGIVLLSNDHKLPTIPISETFCTNLEFFAVQSGYFHSIPGLKVLDLNTQEVLNIGVGLRVLVE